MMCLVCHIGSVAQRFLARHHTVLQIGSTVFVHGGILPSHADYGLERINRYYSAVVCYSLCMQCSAMFAAYQSAGDCAAEYTDDSISCGTYAVPQQTSPCKATWQQRLNTSLELHLICHSGLLWGRVLFGIKALCLL